MVCKKYRVPRVSTDSAIGGKAQEKYSKDHYPGNADHEWLPKFFVELLRKMHIFVKYACCFPLKPSQNFYSLKPQSKLKNRKISFASSDIAVTLKKATFVATPGISLTYLHDDLPSTVTFDTIIPESDIPVSSVSVKVQKKNKIKNFFKKLNGKPNDKSRGEYITVRDGGSVMSNSKDNSSEGSLPDVFGDGPQRTMSRSSRKRVTGFFLDIYGNPQRWVGQSVAIATTPEVNETENS